MAIYTISISGRGVELAIGSISREAYDFWIEKDPDTMHDHIFEQPYEESEENLVHDEDDSRFIGYWHEIDDVFHVSAAIKDYAYLSVKDEDDNIAFELDLAMADNFRVRQIINTDELDSGTYLESWSNEKGIFFLSEIEDTEFNPTALDILVDQLNGDTLITRVLYKNKEIPNEGSDTDIKSYNYVLHEVL